MINFRLDYRFSARYFRSKALPVTGKLIKKEKTGLTNPTFVESFIGCIVLYEKTVKKYHSLSLIFQRYKFSGRRKKTNGFLCNPIKQNRKFGSDEVKHQCLSRQNP